MTAAPEVPTGVTRRIEPLTRPPQATLRTPGSKSLTNRAILLAALADGPSEIYGALHADDAEAMVDAARALGARVDANWDAAHLSVTPHATAAHPEDGPVVIQARLSGTTARFALAAAATLRRPVLLDGEAPLRARPIGPLVDALRAAGARIDYRGEPGGLPLIVDGATLQGGEVTVEAGTSSQFLSAMLLAAPHFPDGLHLHVPPPVVAQPFIELTVEALGAFGVHVERPDPNTYQVAPQQLRGADYHVEPDATSASYFFAAALITGGTITLEGLGTATRQGDMAFLDVLEAMGATVERGASATTVTGGPIRGIDVDLSTIPDTAQTLAAVAVFADGPTRVRGVDYIRGHETDRVAAVVTELRRLGIDADETDDGFSIEPGPIRPATVQTYRDHRMAMSFSLIGLRAPGVTIADPDVVAKTFPRYFDEIDRLRSDSEPSDQ